MLRDILSKRAQEIFEELHWQVVDGDRVVEGGKNGRGVGGAPRGGV
jgi:hypothetical protein